MKIFYRLSYGSYQKRRLKNATKENCLDNFLGNCLSPTHDELILLLDGVEDQTPFFRSDIHIVSIDAGSSAASFREALLRALNEKDDEIVWFQEDDYAHLPGSRKVLLEGIERADYVTLYTHPDKFLPASKGGNPYIGDDGAEITKVFVTESSYWMMTNSTTMTFASRVKTLREDYDVWEKWTRESYPQDMKIFLELRQKDRSLIQPIPSFSTHCEIPWLAHLHGTGINSWNEVLAKRSHQ